jgi:hypothetical protein
MIHPSPNHHDLSSKPLSYLLETSQPFLLQFISFTVPQYDFKKLLICLCHSLVLYYFTFSDIDYWSYLCKTPHMICPFLSFQLCFILTYHIPECSGFLLVAIEAKFSHLWTKFCYFFCVSAL